jgi:putative transposase
MSDFLPALKGEAFRPLNPPFCKSLRRMRLHDVTFHELKETIRYQMEKYGKKLVLVNPAFSSKTCARRGYVK